MHLQEWLYENRLTQKQFAAAIGLSENTLCNIHKRLHTTRLDIAVLIYHATGGEVDYLDMLPDQQIQKIKRNLNIKGRLRYSGDPVHPPELTQPERFESREQIRERMKENIENKDSVV